MLLLVTYTDKETVVEYIVLGLLLLKPRTIYELRKRIDEGLNLMYSCSTGSIQAALGKLLRAGHIRVEERTEKGKKKKLYVLTDEGKRRFESWANGPIESGAIKSPELAKIYFMGFTAKENRAEIIERRIGELQEVLADLERICAEGEALAAEMRGNEVFLFQLQTAKYGRDLMRFQTAWYRRLSETVGEGGNGISAS